MSPDHDDAAPVRRWVNDEPGATQGLRVLATLIVRGASRPLCPLLLSACVAAVSYLLLSSGGYRASAYLRVTEGNLNDESGPSERDELRGWLESAVTTSAALSQLAQAHRLYPREQSIGPHAVVDRFRRDLELDVADNYFLLDRRVGHQLRSANLAIRFRASSAPVAADVVEALANRAIDFQRAEEEWRRRQILVLRERLAPQPGSLPAGLDRLERAGDRRLTLTRVEHPRPVVPVDALRVAVVLGALFSPIAAAVAGAFDGRVRTLPELEDHGPDDRARCIGEGLSTIPRKGTS